MTKTESEIYSVAMQVRKVVLRTESAGELHFCAGKWRRGNYCQNCGERLRRQPYIFCRLKPLRWWNGSAFVRAGSTNAGDCRGVACDGTVSNARSR